MNGREKRINYWSRVMKMAQDFNAKEPAMPEFRRLKPQKARRDDRGTVVVKIFLQDPRKEPGFPVLGNYREEISVDGATVGEVVKEIEKALFGEEESPDVEKLTN